MDFFSRLLFQMREESSSKSDLFLGLFGKIEEREIKTKNIELYSLINSSTKNIASYFEKALENFPSLFEKDLKSFQDCLNYLETNSIPNKNVCAAIIDTIPGWRCVDCSKYENSIYCNDCYLNAKDWHKDHKILYLPRSGGMCDCGDVDSLYTHCKKHSGPFKDEKEIDEYIQKAFGKKIVENLKKFFDVFFIEYSKYLILTSKCELFMEDLFDEKFKEEDNEEIINEKNDIKFLKSNFCIVFQNFIYFLRLITKKNLGMVHLISNYFLKNNLESLKLGDEYKTDHRCIEINQQDIKIYYDTVKKENHFCKCPFLRLFMANYRDNVKLDSQEDEREFLFSFTNNLPLRTAFCVMLFFLYNQNIYNNNENLNYCRTQFYLEDGLELIAKKTTFIEDSIDIIYKYALKKMKQKEGKEQNNLKVEMIPKIFRIIWNIYEDVKYYSKPKIRSLMIEKTEYFKKYIDLTCLFQNIYEFISIVPHPQYQDKSFNNQLFEIENILSKVPNLLNSCIDFNKIDKLKEIYGYIINKILNQKEEGINQLEVNEFSFLQPLYRSFGAIINTFCFNHSFMNDCSILESIIFFKKNFFVSQEQIENFVEIILKDYFKLFGFLAGTKNNFFNYYDRINIYFPIYTAFNYYKNDLNLLKYLLVLSEKEIDINSYLKLSNIENVYSTFDNIFNLGKTIENNTNMEEDEEKEETKNNYRLMEFNIQDANNLSEEQRRDFILRMLMNIRNMENNDKNKDEVNIVMQWEMLFQFLISILKDDSSNYFNLIYTYDEILSSKTRKDLFNGIQENNYAMEDLKNILEEKMIVNIISENNFIDKQKLEKKIDEHLLILFEENGIYNQTLDKLTYNKKNAEKKIFYLKDEYLKFLDFNYFIVQKDKSTAQKYILDFKKDVIKTYNYYYYNHSELTFDFFKAVYERVLLSKDNLDLIIKICEKLINEEKIMKYFDKKSIRNSLLPTMLNYLLIFSVINTKSFIEFKMKNKNSINKIFDLLFNFVNNDDKNNVIDKDLEDHIKEVLNQINKYQLINDYYKGDLSKLPKLSYNINILEELKAGQIVNSNNIKIIPEVKNVMDEKKQKSKQVKEKLKLKMQKKTNNFMKKIESSEEISKAIEEHINELETMKNKDNETMCFYCRNPIRLDSFKEPYGKLGLNIKDLFYINTIKATLREEFSKLKINNQNNNIYENLMNIYGQKFYRVISCGHYFHNSCFLEGYNKGGNTGFNCPLCLKQQNILIPPLTLFHDKYSFLQSEKIDELFKEEKKENKIEEIKSKNDEIILFKPIIISYLESINIFKKDINNYSSFLDNIFPYYQAYINYYENIFFVDGTTFHKQQQIDNIKNLILSLRFIFHDSINCRKEDIIEFIKEIFLKLNKGPEENTYIYQYPDSYMHFMNLFEKIVLSLLIIFDYKELKQTFKYLLYIFLPYFCFGLYFKKLIIENKNELIDKEKFLKKMNLNDFQKYFEDNNKRFIKGLNLFLKKFCFIKLISDYQIKNEEIINTINDLSFKNVLSLIDMEDFANLLIQKEINIKDILKYLPETFKSDDSFYKLFSPEINIQKILNSIFENVIKHQDEIDFNINQELLIQFIPPQFNLINFEYNVFDFIEKFIGKKCDVCGKIPKHPFLCLICGNKVCKLDNNEELFIHVAKCTGEYCIYISMHNMMLHYYDLDGKNHKLYPIYVNKVGTGPKGNEISKEFNLSDENLKNTIKNYVSKDFYFNH